MMETDILLQRVVELIEDNINEKLTIPYIFHRSLDIK